MSFRNYYGQYFTSILRVGDIDHLNRVDLGLELGLNLNKVLHIPVDHPICLPYQFLKLSYVILLLLLFSLFYIHRLLGVEALFPFLHPCRRIPELEFFPPLFVLLVENLFILHLILDSPWGSLDLPQFLIDFLERWEEYFACGSIELGHEGRFVDPIFVLHSPWPNLLVDW